MWKQDILEMRRTIYQNSEVKLRYSTVENESKMRLKYLKLENDIEVEEEYKTKSESA